MTQRPGAAPYPLQLQPRFSSFLKTFNCGKIHLIQNSPPYPFLSVQFRGIHCTHIAVQPLPPPPELSQNAKLKLYPSNDNSPSPPPHPSPWKPPFYYLSRNLTPQAASYKWNHKVLVFLRLACIMSSRVIRIVACVSISFLTD